MRCANVACQVGEPRNVTGASNSKGSALKLWRCCEACAVMHIDREWIMYITFRQFGVNINYTTSVDAHQILG